MHCADSADAAGGPVCTSGTVAESEYYKYGILRKIFKENDKYT